MRAHFSHIFLTIFMLTSGSIFCQTTISSDTHSDFLTSILNEKINNNDSFQRLSFFGEDFNLLSYKKKNISAGLNILFEEELPDNDLKLSNFFVYDFSVNYFLDQFRISLFFENFLNLTSKELSIAPAYIENMNTLVYLEHDTPSMIHLSLVYSF